MRLELHPDDLVASAMSKPISTLDFKDLKWEAQAAVKAVGCGTVYDWEKDNYNVIYPPEVVK